MKQLPSITNENNDVFLSERNCEEVFRKLITQNTCSNIAYTYINTYILYPGIKVDILTWKKMIYNGAKMKVRFRHLSDNMSFIKIFLTFSPEKL